MCIYVCKKNALDIMERTVVFPVQQGFMEINVNIPATVLQTRNVIHLLAVSQTLHVVSLKYTINRLILCNLTY